jgi:hypothetical protein
VAHSSSLRGELNPQTPAIAGIGLKLEEAALAHLLKDASERAWIEMEHLRQFARRNAGKLVDHLDNEPLTAVTPNRVFMKREVVASP